MTVFWDRGGAVVIALASHQCVPGSIPGPGVICGLSLLLVLALAAKGFSPGSPVFLPPQKPTFLNFNSIGYPRAMSLSVEDCSVSPSLNKVDYFIYLLFETIPRFRRRTENGGFYRVPHTSISNNKKICFSEYKWG